MKKVKIDTVDYEYPSCGGWEGNYYPDTGLIVATVYSNYSGSQNNKKIRVQVTPMTRDMDNIIECLEDDNTGDRTVLRSGHVVQ